MKHIASPYSFKLKMRVQKLIQLFYNRSKVEKQSRKRNIKNINKLYFIFQNTLSTQLSTTQLFVKFLQKKNSLAYKIT